MSSESFPLWDRTIVNSKSEAETEVCLFSSTVSLLAPGLMLASHRDGEWCSCADRIELSGNVAVSVPKWVQLGLG